MCFFLALPLVGLQSVIVWLWNFLDILTYLFCSAEIFSGEVFKPILSRIDSPTVINRTGSFPIKSLLGGILLINKASSSEWT